MAPKVQPGRPIFLNGAKKKSTFIFDGRRKLPPPYGEQGSLHALAPWANPPRAIYQLCMYNFLGLNDGVTGDTLWGSKQRGSRQYSLFSIVRWDPQG